MRKPVRLVAAALLSVVALGLVPAGGSTASADMKPMNVYCCK